VPSPGWWGTVEVLVYESKAYPTLSQGSCIVFTESSVVANSMGASRTLGSSCLCCESTQYTCDGSFERQDGEVFIADLAEKQKKVNIIRRSYYV